MVKLYDLNLYEHLNMLECCPNKDTADNDLVKLAPWNEDVQEKCSKRNERNGSAQEI